MKRIVAILLLITVIASCTKDNDDIINTELEGKWTLTSASCFCYFGEDPDFSTHKITFEGSDLNVENSGDIQFLTTAAGSYTVEGNVVTFANDRKHTYVVKDDILELTFVDDPELADDEMFLQYIKN